MLEKLLSLDRRWIFLIIAIVVLIPAVLKISVPVSTISNATQQFYDTIEGLEVDQVVMISLDYGMPSFQFVPLQRVIICKMNFLDKRVDEPQNSEK